MRCYCWCV